MNTILIVIISILIFQFFVDSILGYLNLKSGLKPLPKELEGIYTSLEHDKSKEYQKATNRVGTFKSVLDILIILILLINGWLGEYSDFIMHHFSNQIVHGLVFVGSLYILSDILSLPFSYYSTFNIEERFGFNKSTPKLFFIDKLKSYLMAIVVGGIVLGVLLFLIEWFGSSFWWKFWIFITVFSIVINLLYTKLFVPFFNKLTPLQEGELKNAISDYSKKVDFPLSGVFVIDGSKRSSKANAYFTGMGKVKKIVLFDTLIEKLSNEELVAVLAHEVGHYKKKHIVKGLVMSIIQTGAILFVLSFFIQNIQLSVALGSQLTTPTLILNLIAFMLLIGPISELLGLLFNVISRKNEFEADEYAKQTFGGKYLVSALKKLTVTNLSNLTPHPWFVFVNYSHPPVYERIKELEK
ncbi:M48 family metallopeptidase [Aureibacter tunicatorum]|uniref:STE24 endopeptidase n=1 Tax=Aureibacter tunicatorum TaxID=866807 RepID=A0AAE3XJV2_9BACT|nr:M48 family metallopeptidase [Aureibacter tunicatorum]MDR6239106.1 STE24 endopeptidase [Aureibacter tunicatorum]BDD04968.1 peptidase M48 [Aureibacter tunicatorum]